MLRSMAGCCTSQLLRLERRPAGIILGCDRVIMNCPRWHEQTGHELILNFVPGTFLLILDAYETPEHDIITASFVQSILKNHVESIWLSTSSIFLITTNYLVSVHYMNIRIS